MRVLAAFLLVLVSQQSLANCELTVTAGDTLAFNTNNLEVSRSCETVKVTFTHTGSMPVNMMGHNWVLAKEADVQAIGQDGLSQGLENNYMKPNDERVLVATNMIGGGESTSIEFSLADLPESEYTYFCSFAGHWAVMKGTLKII